MWLKIIAGIMQVAGTCLMYYFAITPFLDDIKKNREFVIDLGTIPDDPEKQREADKKYINTHLFLANLGFYLLIAGIVLGIFD